MSNYPVPLGARCLRYQGIVICPVHVPCHVQVAPVRFFLSITQPPVKPTNDPDCGPGGLGGLGPLNEPVNVHFLLSRGSAVHPLPPTHLPCAIVGLVGGGYDPTKVPLQVQRPLPRYAQPIPTSAANVAGTDDATGAKVRMSVVDWPDRWNDARRLWNRRLSSDTMYAGINRKSSFPGKR